MKKTLIALMALASVACAVDAPFGVDAAFTTAPTVPGDFWASDYEFTFTLGDLYSMDCYGTVLGYYAGTALNNDYGCNAIVLGGSDEALTLTIGRGKVTNTDDGAIAIDTGFVFKENVTFTTEIQKGVTYTLSVTGANQAMTPTLTWEGGSETLASYNGNMNGYKAAMNVVAHTNIPEPATATLSLLALAGLCARRRRA